MKPKLNGAQLPALAPVADAVRGAVLALPLNRLPFLAGGAGALRPPQKDGDPAVLVFTFRVACTLSSGRELTVELPIGLPAHSLPAHSLAEHLRNVATACDDMEAQAALARAQAAEGQPNPALIA